MWLDKTKQKREKPYTPLPLQELNHLYSDLESQCHSGEYRLSGGKVYEKRDLAEIRCGRYPMEFSTQVSKN